MLTRREFIKLILASTAGLSLTEALIPHLASALAGKQSMPIIWLETNTCGGDILSFLNALTPTIRELLYSERGLLFSNTLSVAEGKVAVNQMFNAAEENRGKFILVVEGSIPTKSDGKYAVIGHRENGQPITALEALKILAPKAKYIIAAGTCSSFGGPYAAKPNPTGSKSVSQIIGEPVINVSGCPAHPDWMTGTITHLLLYGFPKLDVHRRPIMFYGQLIHDLCPRRQYYDNGKFAKKPGDPQCLYKIGCKGPSTFSDCPTRKWASFHYNWPIGANTPCIGCTSPEFPDGDAPFFERLPGLKVLGTTVSANTVGTIVGVATMAGIGTHLVGNIASGRLQNVITKGRREIEEEKDMKESLNVADEININENNQQNAKNTDLINLKLTKNEAAELLDILVEKNAGKSKKWPNKVEYKLKRAFLHDGNISDKGKKSFKNIKNKTIFKWLKSKLGISSGEKNE